MLQLQIGIIEVNKPGVWYEQNFISLFTLLRVAYFTHFLKHIIGDIVLSSCIWLRFLPTYIIL